MTRCRLWIGASLISLCTSFGAFAQEQPCPDGSWLCQSNAPGSTNTSPDPSSTTPSSAQLDGADASEFARSEQSAQQQAQSPGQPHAKERLSGGNKRRKQGKSARKTANRSHPNRGTIDVYQTTTPSPDVVIVQPHPNAVPPSPPPKPKLSHFRKWGMNVRLSSAAFQADREDSAMGGAGVGFRARPVAPVAVELGFDLIGGRDYYGYRRIEVPVSASALLYVNPYRPVQFYMLGGLTWSRAFVKDTDYDKKWTYSYFGGQLGPGLEFRFSPTLSGSLDFIGFIRSRVDDGTRHKPEFRDRLTGRYSNSSCGMLFRGGLTVYF